MAKEWKAARGLKLTAGVLAGGMAAYFFLGNPANGEPGAEMGPGAQGAPATLAAAPQEAPAPVVAEEPAAPMVIEPILPAARVLDTSKYPDLAGKEPRRITVDFDNLMLEEAVQAFASQAGVSTYGIGVRGPVPGLVPPDHRVSMHLHDAPLLQGVLEMVNEGARLRDLNEKGISLMPSRTSTAGTGAICVAGPYATTLEYAAKGVPMVRGEKVMEANQAKLVMAFYAEPTIHLLEVKLPPVFEELVDDKGQKATCDSETVRVNRMPTGTGMELKLTFPAEPGARMTSMRGKIMITEQVKAEVVSSGNLAALPNTQKAGEISVLFEGFKQVERVGGRGGGGRPEQQLYELSIVFSRGNYDAAKWKKLATILPTLGPRVASQQGPAMSTVGSTNKTQKEDVDLVRMTYLVGGGNANLVPDRASFMVPVEVLEVGVPFEFRDVGIR